MTISSQRSFSGARTRAHVMPFGTTISNGSFQSRIWAPDAETVHFYLHDNGTELVTPMQAVENGWFALDDCPQAKVGSLYQFIINRGPESAGQKVPDPASRRNPQGVHGPSEIVDPAQFKWQPSQWRGRPYKESVIYELHVGTFTQAGTLKAAQRKLKHIATKGYTVVELMPLWETPGDFSWGYDGTLLFALNSKYGTPEDLKNFVQAAHKLGLAVWIDKVFNHFGPAGNYLYCYAGKHFFNAKDQTPWGAAINFDGPGSDVVRSFFRHCALFWLEEYDLDGIRFDATHAIVDHSPKHIVFDDIEETIALGPGSQREIHLVIENETNSVVMLKQTKSDRSRGMHGVWNDDFQHAVHVLITGETHGYFGGYAKSTVGTSSTEFLGRCLAQFFGHQGTKLPNGHLRGECSKYVPLKRGVIGKSHDQIGNRALGERFAMLVKPEELKAAIAVQLLAPQVILTFMGEEWGSRTAWNFFCDLGPELEKAVRDGRRNEFKDFPGFTDPAERAKIPDPCSRRTFNRSKLNWKERRQPFHQEVEEFYTKLLHLRMREIVPIMDEIVVPIKGGPEMGPSYNVLGDGRLEVIWPLGNGKQLMLLTNLAAGAMQSATLKGVIDSSRARIIYTMDAEGLTKGEMKPWSVTWLIF
jgi:1,4-alpha-glucan branching enzyme/maltooligosyltrehalose trehalohydrolase